MNSEAKNIRIQSKMTDKSDSKSMWKKTGNYSDLWHILLKYSQKNCELKVLASRIERDGHKKFFAN